MKLNLVERISLIGILPDESSYAALRMCWIIKRSCSYTDAEVKEFEIKFEGNRYSWNDKGALYVKEIPFSDEQTTFIKQLLIDLDAKKKLNLQNFSLFEKFVMEYREG